ncbi:hypothetical protein [Blastomonas sp. AAP53]|uniref:hypothetical protein n=1 Tax=Blastomonas sp. AAP53 TaxID=1248760 RepID=UPI0002D6EB16|nr:hypothetical protein [Blastomonas sp. AAP53]
MPYVLTQLSAMALLSATISAPDAAVPAGSNLLFVPPVSDEAAQQIGAATNCIALHRVRSTRIIAGEGIVYELSGQKALINRPRHGGSRLARHQILITRTSGSMLCAGDIVHLADSLPGMTTGFVALGRFEAYTPVPAPAPASAHR